jgi:7-cyano-7-deazaguanine synthase in queuosine biosynthesis
MHLHNIDGVNIPLDPEWKDIAVSVSGGADSALLAYLVSKLAREQDQNVTVHIISHVRNWKSKPWQQYNARRVYDWLLWKFYHVDFKRHVNFIAPELEYEVIGPNLTDEYGKKVSGDNIQQRAYAEFICKTHNIEAYYNGVTRNPRLAQFNGMAERDIERTEENSHLEIMHHMGIWALHPFRFVTKDWVLKQYKDNDIMDLFELTRSCEGTANGITYENYVKGQEVPVCGKCFWCKEREWAIEQNK